MRAIFVLLIAALGILAGCGGSGGSSGGATDALKFTMLADFDGANGSGPQYSLVQGSDGNLYGITTGGGGGGLPGAGTVFKMTPGGVLTTLYSFCTQPNCAIFPNTLVLATDGNFYGTAGGTGISPSFDDGVVFKITPEGVLTTLYNYCLQANCPDGAGPNGLLQSSDGNFYGTTFGGGNSSTGCDFEGCGTLFKITPGGALTTLYRFCAQTSCLDGANPNPGLIQSSDGSFYLTTFGGGSNGNGLIVKITPEGALTVLYSFCAQANCPDGYSPRSGAIQASDGNFYGTLADGGTGSGTVYKLTAEGTLTTLYSFCTQTNCADGANPYAGLIQASDGNFYGTTVSGGNPTCGSGLAHGVPTPFPCGTVFRITPAGQLTTVHTFQSAAIDGFSAQGALLQAANGTLYGTTSSGGPSDNGTGFSLSGLGP